MKFLITGMGSIGRRHYKNLSALDAGTITVVRRKLKPDTEQEKFLREYRPTVSYDIAAALRGKPDAVFVTNPTSFHLATARAAVAAGAHVFIEKPLSHTTKGIQSFLTLARTKKRIVYVGYNFRHHPQLVAIKKMLLEKKLGHVFFARFTTGEYLPGWHPWENYRKGYAARQDLGGGVLLTQSHDIDTALWLFGVPSRVTGHASRSGLLNVTADDSADLILEYPSLSIAIHLDELMQPPVKLCEIYGTKGTVAWDYHTSTLRTKIGTQKKTERLKNFDRNDMYVEELKEFLSCIRNKQVPKSDGAAGARVVLLTETIRRN